MAKEIWVNFGSDNDLMADGTKPLPEPMLTVQCLSNYSVRCVSNRPFKIIATYSQGQ